MRPNGIPVLKPVGWAWIAPTAENKARRVKISFFISLANVQRSATREASCAVVRWFGDRFITLCYRNIEPVAEASDSTRLELPFGYETKSSGDA
jgi:hypothetical protein